MQSWVVGGKVKQTKSFSAGGEREYPVGVIAKVTRQYVTLADGTKWDARTGIWREARTIPGEEQHAPRIAPVADDYAPAATVREGMERIPQSLAMTFRAAGVEVVEDAAARGASDAWLAPAWAVSFILGANGLPGADRVFAVLARASRSRSAADMSAMADVAGLALEDGDVDAALRAIVYKQSR